MTKQEIIKKVNSFQGANREFSQEMGPIVEGILDIVEDNTEAIETKQNAPEEAGTAGQILKLDANGDPVWSDAPDGSVIDDEMSDESPNPVKNNVIWSWVTGLIAAVKTWASGTFARIDGWYSTLVAGAAENLVGHGTTPAEYTFRTSGGNADIGTGTATIDVLKGKTLKWNQMVKNGNFTDTSNWGGGASSFTVSDNIASVTIESSNTGIQQTISVVNGHKYYVRCDVKKDAGVMAVAWSGNNTFFNDTNERSGFYHLAGIKAADGTGILIRPIWWNENSGDGQVKGVMCIDLTDLFGEGNEPTTVAEFEALYPLDYYDYTATPVLINNAASGIVTTGFNQWDEEWENGEINTTTGQNTGSTYVRSKNYIRILPNTVYNFTKLSGWQNVRLFFYDVNFNYLPDVEYKSAVTSFQIDTSNKPNAAYMRFYTWADTTYNHDICINISWSGYRNGEYEPYEKHTLYFNGENGSLATATGKKIVNGSTEGQESVTIFPDGMKSAGSVYDFGKADSDGYIRKVTKRLGVVDLADPSLEWNTGGTDNKLWLIYCSHAQTNNSIAETINLQTTGYANNLLSGQYNTRDSAIAIYFGLSSDPKPTGKLIYELETPEEYLLDTPIPANYLVNDFGTEQRIPVDTASSVMAPISYEVAYAMNATDTIRRLPVNYIKKESMDNFTTELASKLGTFLDATITITPSYDATNEEYDYSISITANENNG